MSSGDASRSNDTGNAGSVTHWIVALRAGDEQAAQQALFERYFQRLVGLARTRLRDTPRRESDEEDVAVDALNSFFQGVRRERYPSLHDRHNLWPLLAKITACKAINLRDRQLAQKRGGGRVRGDSILTRPGGGNPAGDERIAEFVGDEPSPAFVAEMGEQCQRLLAALDDPALQLIAQRKLEGCSNDEIAHELNVVERTVERKLHRIRAIWQEFADRELSDLSK